MRHGIYVPNFGEYGDPRVLADLAREAEDQGWDGFFLWDHVFPFLSEVPPWPGCEPLTLPVAPLTDVWVALSAAATRTGRIRLGALVTPLPRCRPQHLARTTVSVDRLSGGRLVVGVGTGGPADSEFGRFGGPVDARTRAAMLDEGLDVLTGLWSGLPCTYGGEHFRVEDVTFLPTPAQVPGIPVWVAGIWPHKRPFRRAARYDGVFPLPVQFGRADLGPDDYREICAYIREHRAGGEPFDVVHYGSGPAPEELSTKEYAAAGVTWWLQGDIFCLASTRELILAGPPETTGVPGSV